MADSLETFTDRRFWAYTYASTFGAIGERPELEVVCSLLGLYVPEILDWSRNFERRIDEVFDTSADHTASPIQLRLALVSNFQLLIEWHPGDIDWYLRSAAGAEAKLANVGGHWELPGLRWQEARTIAAATRGPTWVTTLLLSPIVWLTAGDDVEAARREVEVAWAASGFAAKKSASALADLWVRGVEGGLDYEWRRGDPGVGWVCTAEWSTRSERRPAGGVARINRLIAAADGAA